MNSLERLAVSPMTGSDAGYLVGLYGEGMGLDEFAALLPKNARVIDIASGLSNFGVALAALREDISVVNLDIQYSDEEKVGPLREDAPPNVEYVAADALNLPEEMLGQFDYAFSYNFYSHAMRADTLVGRRALEGAMGLLKPHGSLFVGPTNSKATTEKRWNTHAIDRGGPESETPVKDEDIAEAAGLLTTPRMLRPVYDAMLNTGIGVYPRQRFEPGQKGLVISRDSGANFVPVASFRGAAMAFRLGLQTIVEMFRR